MRIRHFVAIAAIILVLAIVALLSSGCNWVGNAYCSVVNCNDFGQGGSTNGAGGGPPTMQPGSCPFPEQQYFGCSVQAARPLVFPGGPPMALAFLDAESISAQAARLTPNLLRR